MDIFLAVFQYFLLLLLFRIILLNLSRIKCNSWKTLSFVLLTFSNQTLFSSGLAGWWLFLYLPVYHFILILDTVVILIIPIRIILHVELFVIFSFFNVVLDNTAVILHDPCRRLTLFICSFLFWLGLTIFSMTYFNATLKWLLFTLRRNFERCFAWCLMTFGGPFTSCASGTTSVRCCRTLGWGCTRSVFWGWTSS